MVISFTCNNIGTGGAERVITSIANQMALDGHIVRIICYKKLESFYYELEAGVSIIELDPLINKRKSAISRKLAGIINLIKLYDAIKGSDRVVSFYTRQNCYSILMCKLRGIPIVCAERDHFFMNDGKVNHLMRRVFYPMADGFVHQTKMAQQYLRENEGVSCKDIVIPNPLWITDFSDRIPVDGRVIAVGRLANQKNYEGMIRAFKKVVERVPYATLHIFGDGDQTEYQKLITEKGLDNNVILEGLNKNIIGEYAKADIFIMFSHGEGYPNALMEALAMGVPCVSSDCPVGGPRDMIVNGINGFLVEHENEDELSNRIAQLLQSKELKETFSNNAIEIRESNRFATIYKRYMDFIVSCDIKEHKTK